MAVTNPSSIGRPPAIILGLEHPRALAVIQSLGAMGVPLIGIDHVRARRSAASRYLKKVHVVPATAEAMLPLLESLAGGERAVLIPTNDEHVMVVSQNAERLRRNFVVAVPGWDVVEPLMDLAASYELGRECGVKTPTIYQPKDEADLRRIVAGLDLEHKKYLFRTPPVHVPADVRTGRFSKGAGTDAETIIANALEIRSRLGEFPIIAEAVPGHRDQCISVHVVADANHEYVVGYCVRRPTIDAYIKARGFVHPYDMGVAAYCETVRDDEALELAKRIVRRSGFTGALTIELRRDPRDGQLVLIKTDTGLPRELAISRAIGLDASAALYRMLIGEPQPPSRDYTEGAVWIWPTQYFNAILTQRSNPQAVRELLSALRRFYRVRAMAYWSASDPGPFAVELMTWAKNRVVWALRRLMGRVADANDPVD